jgi:CheY-like chemotaxis protein
MTETILIVDDSTFIVEGLVALLKKTYQPIPSYGGEECLEILRKVTPSLIILDIMMEPMDGWETLSRIKNNPKTRHIPVLMFSAKKISPEEAEAHRIIIDDFLTKPVNPKKLLEAIGKILSRQESNRRIIRTWNAAGVSPEIIDEYLTLKTNLDVDVSFLAVMQKQLEMAFPDSGNREDLARSVSDLEERIRATRARIDAFCQEKSDLLPARDANPESLPGPGPGLVAEETGDEPAPAPIPPAMVPEFPVVSGAEVLPAGVPAPEPGSLPTAMGSKPDQLPASEPANARVPDAPLAPPEETLPHTISEKPVVMVPPPGPKPVFMHARTTSPAGWDTSPVEHTPVHEEKDVVPVPAPATPPPAAPATEQVPDYSDLFEPFEENPEPASPGQTPQPAGVTESKSPRITRPAGSGSGPSAGPGSGTLTPPMHTRGSSPRGQRYDPEDEPASRTPVPSEESGFFSRLLSAITGLFRRQRS